MQKIENFLNNLYQEFIFSIDKQQGQITYYYKLFLHVLYEIDSSLRLFKSILDNSINELQQISQSISTMSQLLTHCLNTDKNFEALISWLESRSKLLQQHSSYNSLQLIFNLRRMIFKLLDRDREYAFYTMKLTRVMRKYSDDIILLKDLYNECELY